MNLNHITQSKIDNSGSVRLLCACGTHFNTNPSTPLGTSGWILKHSRCNDNTEIIKFNKQKIKHNPSNGEYGDCYRTCVSCILKVDVDDVPHVYANGESPDEGDLLMNEFLNENGFSKLQVCFDGQASLKDALSYARDTCKSIPAILTGSTSPGSVGHCVIAFNGEIIHDVSDVASQVSMPASDSGLWHFEFITRNV